MDIRETMNRHPVASIALAAVVLIAAIWVVLAQSGSTAMPAQPKSLYFTDDDGQTFFTDNADKVAPFERNGKQVAGAHVFASEGGKPFVGYMERAISPQGRTIVEQARRDQLEQAKKLLVPMPDSALMEKLASNLEVKKPGESKWVPALSAAAAGVLAVKSPNGLPVSEVPPR